MKDQMNLDNTKTFDVDLYHENYNLRFTQPDKTVLIQLTAEQFKVFLDMANGVAIDQGLITVH